MGWFGPSGDCGCCEVECLFCVGYSTIHVTIDDMPNCEAMDGTYSWNPDCDAEPPEDGVIVGCGAENDDIMTILFNPITNELRVVVLDSMSFPVFYYTDTTYQLCPPFDFDTVGDTGYILHVEFT